MKLPFRLKLPFDFPDALAVAGLGLVGYGLWLFFPPAAFVVVGGVVLIAATRLSK